MDSDNRRDKMIILRDELLAVEVDRSRGRGGFSVSEVASMMRDAVRETAEND